MIMLHLIDAARCEDLIRRHALMDTSFSHTMCVYRVTPQAGAAGKRHRTAEEGEEETESSEEEEQYEECEPRKWPTHTSLHYTYTHRNRVGDTPQSRQ
jgi:hypothetical protein